jgi:hypothetical protein
MAGLQALSFGQVAVATGFRAIADLSSAFAVN